MIEVKIQNEHVVSDKIDKILDILHHENNISVKKVTEFETLLTQFINGISKGIGDSLKELGEELEGEEQEGDSFELIMQRFKEKHQQKLYRPLLEKLSGFDELSTEAGQKIVDENLVQLEIEAVDGVWKSFEKQNIKNSVARKWEN